MILVWSDARSFQRHLEDMGRFRRWHQGAGSAPGNIQDLPAMFDIEPVESPGRSGARVFARVRGRPMIVPIWDMDLPGNLQN